MIIEECPTLPAYRRKSNPIEIYTIIRCRLSFQKFFLNHKNANRVENDFVDELGDLIDAIDFDDQWNVDMRRLFLFITWVNNQEAMTARAFKRLTRFLGFTLFCPSTGIPVLTSRRRFDSVVDPNAPDTPFDTSFFDTGAGDFPFVTIQFTFFKEAPENDDENSSGSTSIPATRQFTDTSGLGIFTQVAQPGSLLVIRDLATPGDNGQFIVSSVIDDSNLIVTEDWPQGSNSGLDYTLNWQVPCADPFIDSILERMQKIKARWQKLSCVSIEV